MLLALTSPSATLVTLFPPAFTPALEIDTVLFGSLTEPSSFKLSALLTATPAGVIFVTSPDASLNSALFKPFKSLAN